MKLNGAFGCKLSDEDIWKASGSRLGWYRRCGMSTANLLLSPKVLALPNKKREPTGIGRSSRLRPEKHLKPCYGVAPYIRPVRTVQWEGRGLSPSLYPIFVAKLHLVFHPLYIVQHFDK